MKFEVSMILVAAAFAGFSAVGAAPAPESSSVELASETATPTTTTVVETHKTHKTKSHKPHKTKSHKPHKTKSHRPHKTKSHKPHKTKSHKPRKTKTPTPAPSVAVAAGILEANNTPNNQPNQTTIETSLRLPKGLNRKSVLHGQGHQIYTCTRANNRYQWVLTNVEAKLKSVVGKKPRHVADHKFVSGLPTFIHNDARTPQDVSRISGKVNATVTTFSGLNNLPWALLKVTNNTFAKPTDYFANTRYVIRAFTDRGLPNPRKKCEKASHVGNVYPSFYRAEYWFYV
ncbi:hypothetical protein HK105_205547 [Polyrhizophydium stewartii]|uniref:Uncharacterized protein n=1 Tax=Polyrhizophydium stewartii TaxID=2732419 RepID=A0ABR4N624_9FUNG|nr:hypothetical protein HK105_001641 [Polyrhizophydium stewartii]